MEPLKSWFNKFKSKEKSRPSKNKVPTSTVTEELKAPASDEAPSSVTKQKVAAAKEYIENHYKKQMRSMQERIER